MNSLSDRSAFTLIELLVVIAILGVLATAVILVINPAQLLAQARDSTRLSDLATLNQTLSLFQTDQYNRSLGTSSVVYVSVPDSSPTCVNLGLPTLPGGWSYSCAPASTLQKTDGTGWIPVPLNLISSGSPLSKLPIDPVNTTTTGNYYTYTPGGSWELTTIMESQKQKMGGGSDKTSTDGGSYPELYEVGTNLTLLPVDYGDPSLVGYWKFDEGSGTSAYDASGRGNTGNITGSLLWQSGSNCRMGGCINFNGTGKINIPSLYNTNFPTNGTLIMWINSSVWDVGVEHHFFDGFSTLRNHIFLRNDYNTPGGYLQIAFQSASAYVFSAIPQVPVGSWFQIAVVWDTVSHKGYIYLNSNLYSQGSISDSSWTPNGQITYLNDGGNNQGSEDNVRIYNRALSAAEVQAVYNAGN